MAKKKTTKKKTSKKKDSEEVAGELKSVTKPDYKLLRKMLDELFIDGKIPVELSTIQRFFTTVALLFKGKRLEEIGYMNVTLINRFFFIFDYKPLDMDNEYQKFYVDYMNAILEPVKKQLEEQAKKKKTKDTKE